MEQPGLHPKANPYQAAIKVENGSFAWEKGGDAALTGVDLEVLDGQLLMVVGAVGSGKSSLLHALMGEMQVLSGKTFVAGAIASPPRAESSLLSNSSLKSLPARKSGRILGQHVISKLPLNASAHKPFGPEPSLWPYKRVDALNTLQ